MKIFRVYQIFFILDFEIIIFIVFLYRNDFEYPLLKFFFYDLFISIFLLNLLIIMISLILFFRQVMVLQYDILIIFKFYKIPKACLHVKFHIKIYRMPKHLFLDHKYYRSILMETYILDCQCLYL
jgi:hypothetical protein